MNDHILKESVSSPIAADTRQSGRAVIGDIIHRLRQKADNLQKLIDMLPARPTPDQDNALWQIACDLERR